MKTHYDNLEDQIFMEELDVSDSDTNIYNKNYILDRMNSIINETKI
jgi:hypothetical protein